MPQTHAAPEDAGRAQAAQWPPLDAPGSPSVPLTDDQFRRPFGEAVGIVFVEGRGLPATLVHFRGRATGPRDNMPLGSTAFSVDTQPGQWGATLAGFAGTGRIDHVVVDYRGGYGSNQGGQWALPPSPTERWLLGAAFWAEGNMTERSTQDASLDVRWLGPPGEARASILLDFGMEPAWLGAFRTTKLATCGPAALEFEPDRLVVEACERTWTWLDWAVHPPGAASTPDHPAAEVAHADTLARAGR